MNILVATRLKRSEYEAKVCEEAIQSLAGLYPGSNIYRDRDIDWEAWRAQHGGHDGSYKFAAEQFDMFVFIEGVDAESDYLARGQYCIAKEALNLGKQAFVWRSWVLNSIRRLRELPQEDYALRFAEAVI